MQDETRIQLSKAAAKFVEDAHARKAHEAASKMSGPLKDFFIATGRTYADQITVDDIAVFQKHLRKRDLSDRTVDNTHNALLPFLRSVGFTHKLKKPTFVKTKVEVYDEGELKKFFKSLSDPYDVLCWNLFLMTDVREQEACYLEWRDVDFVSATIDIRSKPHLGFVPKDREEREVSIPDAQSNS